MKAIKKFFKFIMWMVIAILALVLTVVLTIPLWIGPVVTKVANWKVPEITKTGFNLGEFGLNPYTGRLHIGDMQLQNPESFYTSYKAKAKSFGDVEGEGVVGSLMEHTKNVGAMVGDVVSTVGDVLSSSETNAVSLTAIDIKVDVKSLLSDTIHVEEIVIKDLYFYGDMTFSNIREIANNAKSFGKAPQPETQGEGAPSGEEPAPEPAPEPESEPQAEAQAEPAPQPQAEPAPAPQPEQKKQKKVVIDRILITGTRIQYGHLRIPLPDIELNDIGKEEGGIDQKNVFYVIMDNICEAADKAKYGVGKALRLAIDGLESIGEVLSDGLSAAKDFAAPAVEVVSGALSSGAEVATETFNTGYEATKTALGTGINATSDALSSSLGATTGAIGTGCEVTAGAISTGAQATVDALSTGTKATVEAVGSGVDSITSGVSSGISSGVNFVKGFGKGKKKE